MRTTVDLDSDLLTRLRREAHRRHVPFKQLLNAAIRNGLAAPATTPPPAYVLPVFALGAVRVGVNLDKALSLAAAFEDREVVEEIERRK
jgi:hypothetical protein